MWDISTNFKGHIRYKNQRIVLDFICKTSTQIRIAVNYLQKYVLMCQDFMYGCEKLKSGIMFPIEVFIIFFC